MGANDKLLRALNKIAGNAGAYAITYMDDPSSPCIVDAWISTGSVVLDKILGHGLPVGRIVELYGDSSTGKTLIAEQAVAMAQQTYPDSVILYIDTERAISVEMMEMVGIDMSTKQVIYADPDTIEEVFMLMETLLENKDPNQLCFIVWDSIAATTVLAEKAAEYGKATMGTHARMMSQGLRKFNRLISKHRACALFLNQTRQKIGVMYGDDTATFGGTALEFYASIRIYLKRGKKITETDKSTKTVVGIMTTAQVTKNKVSVPFKEALLPIYFNTGIDDAEALLYYMKRMNMIRTSGSWSYIIINNEEYKFQGDSWYALYDAHIDALTDMVYDND